jgi:hypothetical protein
MHGLSDQIRCITRTNWSYPLSFFLSTRAYLISPDHISRSQCDGLCHVTSGRGESSLDTKQVVRAKNKLSGTPAVPKVVS